MSEYERRGEHHRNDRLARTKTIVDLVLRLPLADPSQSGEVLDAVGTVYEDLRTLDEQQRLEWQLASGLATSDVERAIEDVRKAGLSRAQDETFQQRRMLVLAGLARILEATIINERIGTQSDSGVSIVQVGIQPDDVAEAMVHARQAGRMDEAVFEKELLDETKPARVEMPEEEIIDVQAQVVSEELIEDIVDVEGLVTPSQTAQVQKSTREIVSGLLHTPAGRRKVLGWGAYGALMFGLTIGIPVGANRTRESPQDKAKREAEEVEKHLREHELPETGSKPSPDGWVASYVRLEGGEEYEDMFEGKFRQVLSDKRVIPIYVPQAGSNEPHLQKTTDIIASIKSLGGTSFSELLVDQGFAVFQTYVLDRTMPVLQIRNIFTLRTYTIVLRPVEVNGEIRNQVLYMRKKEKNSQS